MCNFISALPKKAMSSESGSRQRFLNIPLRETPEGQVYRFRLIGFVTKQRDYPFIEKYVHTVFDTNPETGKNELKDMVTCKSTRYVQNTSQDQVKCPICAFVDKQWVAFKSSSYKDKVSMRKKNMFQKRYRAHILAYVVNDPCYEANIGKLKVITLYDQNEYKQLLDLIKKTSMKHSVFNGGDAVDFYLRVGKVQEKWYEGTPNERTVEKLKITDMGFSTKPYSIPEINSNLVDSFPFDEEFFTFSSDEELAAFYKTYCTRPSVQIPDDDIVPSTKPAIANAADMTNHNKTKPVDDIDIGDIEDLISDKSSLVEDLPATPSEYVPQQKSSSDSFDDIDDFINNLGN